MKRPARRMKSGHEEWEHAGAMRCWRRTRCTNASSPRAPSGRRSSLSANPLNSAAICCRRYGPSRNISLKKLMCSTGIALIAGSSGAGKTFAILSLAASLATGKPFFGRAVTKRCGVLFVVGEGECVIQPRFHAAVERLAEEHDDIDPSVRLPVYWCDAPVATDEDRAALIVFAKELSDRMMTEHGVRLGVIVADTFAACLKVEDENSASAVTKALKRPGRHCDATELPSRLHRALWQKPVAGRARL